MGEKEILAAKRMRMLRLGAGMTAEDLAQECARAGVETLDRGTIAKIESDKRQITAGEVDGVARVFGVTSADLLNLEGPVVFLSYAPQDADIGSEVSAWLAGRGFRVSAERAAAADQVARGPQAAIEAAHDFVALLSPAFLNSPASLAEFELAVRHRQRAPSASYVHVLHVADTSHLDASAFSGYHAVDLVQVSGRKREEALCRLGSGILLASAGAETGADTRPTSERARNGWQAFLDRRDELDRVLNGLNRTAGPHFWLVMSPPGLGKTEFLRRLEARAREQAGRQWITKTVDLRAEATDCHGDALALVSKLLDVRLSTRPDDDLRAVAREIIRAGRPHLYLLDSAELLQPSTVAALRRYLSQIYRLVQDRGGPDTGVSLVVASRSDGGWRGVTPQPRLSILPLAEFDAAAVQEAVSELASRMSLQKSPSELRDDAALVHRTAEGIPALVRRVLEWIETEEGLEIERLSHSDVVDEILRPFIRGRLLARDSLLPGEADQSETSERLRVIEQAIKWLVPYRFFTLSYLRHLSDDDSFTTAMAAAGWRVDDLWQAIGDCALLTRPLDEPWQEFHPAVRRLLFRHFYAETERAATHRKACALIDQWLAKQSGREQVMGLLECIWHEAAMLRLTNAEKMGGDLIEFARKRVRTIGDTAVYTRAELRAYAAERMRNDDELRGETRGTDGLFEKLVRIVESDSVREGVI